MSAYLQMPLRETLPWLDGSGPDADIVISTRGRLLRNITAHDFPGHAQPQERQQVAEEILSGLEAAGLARGGHQLELGSLNRHQQMLLREKHLLAEGECLPEHHRHMVASSDGFFVAKINNQDHLRLQLYAPGFQPSRVLAGLLERESTLDSHLDLAFQEDFRLSDGQPRGRGHRLAHVHPAAPARPGHERGDR